MSRLRHLRHARLGDATVLILDNRHPDTIKIKLTDGTLDDTSAGETWTTGDVLEVFRFESQFSLIHPPDQTT